MESGSDPTRSGRGSGRPGRSGAGLALVGGTSVPMLSAQVAAI
ncbi:DUF6053 domain-containing protein [Lysobacter yananisis]